MIRPSPLHALRLLVVTLVPLACSEAHPAPRVILISIDTLRADHLGLYGYARETSPFLDAWAKRALVFEHGFTPAAWTLIAHMTMLTGLYPEQHGVLEGDQALAADAPLLAERFQRAGFATLGLYHPSWVHTRHGFARGFDVFRAHADVKEAGQHLFEELARVPRERPLFLFVHLYDVHGEREDVRPKSVYSAPPPFQELFVPGAAQRFAGETYQDLQHRTVTDPAEREALAALYDEGIRHVDAALGEWFERLEREHWLDDALVIVTSDHGESLAQRGKVGHGGPWQEGLRVPLLVHLPGDARAGERVEAVTHLIDVVPTALAFAGLPADPALPGRSLLGPLARERVLGGANPPIDFVVRWPEKAVRVGERAGSFDLAADPGELHAQPLSEAEFQALRAQLALDPRTFHRPLSIELTPEDAAELRALGYGGEMDGK